MPKSLNVKSLKCYEHNINKYQQKSSMNATVREANGHISSLHLLWIKKQLI